MGMMARVPATIFIYGVNLWISYKASNYSPGIKMVRMWVPAVKA